MVKHVHFGGDTETIKMPNSPHMRLCYTSPRNVMTRLKYAQDYSQMDATLL
jgi:hypothetical protein